MGAIVRDRNESFVVSSCETGFAASSDCSEAMALRMSIKLALDEEGFSKVCFETDNVNVAKFFQSGEMLADWSCAPP